MIITQVYINALHIYTFAVDGIRISCISITYILIYIHICTGIEYILIYIHICIGIEYFLKKFISKNKDPSRKVYHHVTCATDTSNVKIVLNSCKDIILKENLKQAGIAFD